MRVLLAAGVRVGGQHSIGGVQSWNATVSRRLSAIGDDVSVWGPQGSKPVRGRFALGLISHAKLTAVVSGLCDRAKFICHGIVQEEEPPRGPNTIFTSEEVRDFWRGQGPVIRQPIDLEFWAPGEKARTDLLFYSYRAPDAFCLPDLAASLGLQFRRLANAEPIEVRDAMRRSALVCATGRAALEAMACGAPTLICDYRPYNGGPLVSPDLDQAMRANYSGRGGVAPDTIDLKTLARETMAFQRPREHIEAHHDAARIVEQLIC